MYSIEVRNKDGAVLARAEGIGDARLVYHAAYQDGDTIAFRAGEKHAFVQVDQAVRTAPVYMPNEGFGFAIPFGDAQNGYPPQAFAGDMHALSIAPAGADVIGARRNIALNPFDQHEHSGCFPHASANVETRGEAQFWARNAIDGHRFNARHGGWPYHSWGIGERRDAWLRIDFGRPVRVDAVALVLRGHFPHDAWWEWGVVEFSDGHAQTLNLIKTRETQVFATGARTAEWVCLKDLVKADDPSPFPALTQLEVYGVDIE